MSGSERVTRRPVPPAETLHANRTWWDANASDYQAEHGEFLGDADFVWGPEGLREAKARLLGPVARQRGLEVGCGAAQCSRWLIGQGARMLGVDLSAGQLLAATAASTRTGVEVPVVQADARLLPLADATVDFACSAFGALPFIGDTDQVMREVARVLRPGGRWVFSVSHPIRWCFPDDPGPAGLTATGSYFDRTPYVETDEDGHASYVEHHHTVGDWIRQLTAAGLVVDDLLEPEWPAGHDRPWGQWSPLRGRVIPGTAIFVSHRPGLG
jgi:SAM-dependent methyltransferase